MFWLVVEGKRRAIRTRISHGEKEANDSLQHLIAKQMKLSSSEFLEFVKCTIDGTRYAELVTPRDPARGPDDAAAK
jgi:hypothetical protein